MQSFPLQQVHDIRSPLAFANGQYILVERSAYEAAGGHSVVRDRFVEDIALASKVSAWTADPGRTDPSNRFVPDVFVVGATHAGLEPDLLRCRSTATPRGSRSNFSTR